MENRYILGTDNYDDRVFSVAVFDRQTETFVLVDTIKDKGEFEDRVKELSAYYNTCPIREYKHEEDTRPRKFIKLPHLYELLKTEKGKEVLKEYLLTIDAIDHKLIEEFKNFKHK